MPCTIYNNTIGVCSNIRYIGGGNMPKYCIPLTLGVREALKPLSIVREEETWPNNFFR